MRRELLAQVAYYAGALLVLLHGLVHWMGFRVYSGRAVVNGLPYKTTLFNGLWDLGEAGMRWYGWAWLIPMAGLIVSAVAMALRAAWWQPALAGSAAASLIVTGPDWRYASRGALIDMAILALLLVGYLNR
jgi:hypothetical protein